MESVLISIQPKWCELIANGKKTIEVRKTKPSIEIPFKCYIYCTSVKSIPLNEYVKIHQTTGGKIDDWHGKVIGEFFCRNIYDIECSSVDYNYFSQNGTCLSVQEFIRYCNGKDLYGWHISDLVIYDEPKAIDEFYRHDNTYDNAFGYAFEDRTKSVPLKRPPQSWCYVEEVNGNDR